MPTKIFTTISGLCPFGKKIMIDSTGCRSCEHFYRVGTETFFWCTHPVESVPKTPESVPKTKKRGRPAKKAISKPVKTLKKKNG